MREKRGNWGWREKGIQMFSTISLQICLITQQPLNYSEWNYHVWLRLLGFIIELMMSLLCLKICFHRGAQTNNKKRIRFIRANKLVSATGCTGKYNSFSQGRVRIR